MTSETRLPSISLRYLRALLVALLSGLLTSCSTMPTAPLPVPVTLPEESCLALAEPLPTLTDPTMIGLLNLLVSVSDAYHILAARHACVVSFERGK